MSENVPKRSSKGASSSWYMYLLIRSIAWLLTRLVCRFHMSGRENVPESGPLLIVANHLSWFDPLLLGQITSRQVWFFAKEEVFHWPVMGWLCKVTGQIPVHRGVGDRAALEQALLYLHEGRVLVFFPEGTVERQEVMISAHSGIAMLALRSGATLLPVAHIGTRRVLRPGRGWFPRVEMKIGQPYVPQLPEGMARKGGLQEITQEAMHRIAELLPLEQRGVYR